MKLMLNIQLVKYSLLCTVVSVAFCHSCFIHLASSLASPVSFFCSVLRLGLRCRLSHPLSWFACCLGRSLFQVNCGCIKQSELHNSCLASPVAFGIYASVCAAVWPLYALHAASTDLYFTLTLNDCCTIHR